jgi:hypothetical protein
MHLDHIQPAMEAAMLSASGHVSATLCRDRDRVRELIADRGLPTVRAFVTLASGVHISYPGMGGYPAGYDGRAQPKYQLAAELPGIRWGHPFVDRYRRIALLPVAISLYDAEGAFLGVAGMEMATDWLGEHLLRMIDAPYVTASYLVDGDGRVIVAAQADGRIPATAEGAAGGATSAAQGVGAARQGGGADDGGGGAATGREAATGGQAADGDNPLPAERALPLQPLPYPELLPRLAAGKPGHLPLHRDGATRLAVFYPVLALGGFYVVVADERALLRHTRAALRDDCVLSAPPGTPARRDGASRRQDVHAAIFGAPGARVTAQMV